MNSIKRYGVELNLKLLYYYIYFLISMFLTSTLILLKFRNYIYYTLSVLFTFLTTIIFFLAFVKFNNNIQEVILIWFLIILSTITFIGWTQSIYHLIKNRYNEPDYGPTGDQGDKGLTGRTANTSISEYDLCVQQMNDITNKNILKKLKKTETQDNLFNNLFVKDNYKRICSKYFK